MTFAEAVQRVERYAPLLNKQVINREDNTRYELKTITVVRADQRHEAITHVYKITNKAYAKTLVNEDCIILFILYYGDYGFRAYEDNIEALYHIKLNIVSDGR